MVCPILQIKLCYLEIFILNQKFWDGYQNHVISKILLTEPSLYFFYLDMKAGGEGGAENIYIDIWLAYFN